MKEMVNDFTCESVNHTSGGNCGCGCGMKNTNVKDMMAKDTKGSMTMDKNCAIKKDMAMSDCNACVQQAVGLGQAYVPVQTELDLKDKETALACGTAFAQLVQPWVKSLKSK